MNTSVNILLATCALAASFYFGWSYRDYQVKSDLCRGIAQIAVSMHREITDNSPCKPYV